MKAGDRVPVSRVGSVSARLINQDQSELCDFEWVRGHHGQWSVVDLHRDDCCCVCLIELHAQQWFVAHGRSIGSSAIGRILVSE